MSKPRRIQIERFGGLFGALSNPHRLKIFVRLATCCPPGTTCEAGDGAPACVGELGKALDIAPSTLSHHLKELSHAGLIRTTRRGRRIECGVDPDAVQALGAFFGDLASRMEGTATSRARKRR
jgi:DNA-binding transcriptional ArsR family regulator